MTINLWCWYIYIYFRYLNIIYLLLQKRKISFVLFWKEVKQDINTYDKVKQEKLEFQLMFVFDFFRLAWTWKEHVCYQDYEWIHVMWFRKGELLFFLLVLFISPLLLCVRELTHVERGMGKIRRKKINSLKKVVDIGWVFSWKTLHGLPFIVWLFVKQNNR